MYKMKLSSPFAIGSTFLSVSLIRDIIKNKIKLRLSKSAKESIIRCRTYLDKKQEKSEVPIYGINTGFGYLQNIRIDNDDIEQLQNNLLRSHFLNSRSNYGSRY